MLQLKSRVDIENTCINHSLSMFLSGSRVDVTCIKGLQGDIGLFYRVMTKKVGNHCLSPCLGENSTFFSFKFPQMWIVLQR